MANKEPTKAEKLKRELASAIKEEILEKVKPEVLYRSKSNRKFFCLTHNISHELYLHVLNTNKVYDPDFSYKLADLVLENLEMSSIALFTGCWGVTDNPVNSVRESSMKELKSYLDHIADRMCDTVRNTLKDFYTKFRIETDMVPDTTESTD